MLAPQREYNYKKIAIKISLGILGGLQGLHGTLSMTMLAMLPEVPHGVASYGGARPTPSKFQSSVPQSAHMGQSMEQLAHGHLWESEPPRLKIEMLLWGPRGAGGGWSSPEPRKKKNYTKNHKVFEKVVLLKGPFGGSRFHEPDIHMMIYIPLPLPLPLYDIHMMIYDVYMMIYE